MNRIQSSAVERMQLHNFSYENDVDQEWYELFDEGLRSVDHIRSVSAILEALMESRSYTDLVKNLQSAVNIAGRYHREKSELELALYVMDYKMSKLTQLIYDKLKEYYTPEALEELDRFFTRIGITRNHPLDRNKKTKSRLRLVK